MELLLELVLNTHRFVRGNHSCVSSSQYSNNFETSSFIPLLCCCHLLVLVSRKIHQTCRPLCYTRIVTPHILNDDFLFRSQYNSLTKTVMQGSGRCVCLCVCLKLRWLCRVFLDFKPTDLNYHFASSLSLAMYAKLVYYQLLGYAQSMFNTL